MRKIDNTRELKTLLDSLDWDKYDYQFTFDRGDGYMCYSVIGKRKVELDGDSFNVFALSRTWCEGDEGGHIYDVVHEEDATGLKLFSFFRNYYNREGNLYFEDGAESEQAEAQG